MSRYDGRNWRGYYAHETGLPSRGVRKNNYRVLVRTKGPAVLVELGYLV